MGIKRMDRSIYIGDNLKLKLMVDRIDGEDLDTYCQLEGEFAIGGDTKDEFVKKLQELIEQYRI